LGPFKYNAAFHLDNGGYDSDIYYGSTQNHVADYTFIAGTSFRFFLPLKKKVVFDFFEFPQYVFFLDTKSERALNNTFVGQVHFVFDRLYIQAGGGLTNVREHLSTELSMNVRRKEENVSTLALWQVTKGTSFALRFRRLALNYEGLSSGISNIGDSLNRTEDYVNFIAYLQQHSRTRLYLDGEYGSYTFTGDVSRYKDSRSYSVYGSIEFLPPAAGYEGLIGGIRGRLNLGYKRLDFLDPRQKDLAGLVGNTGISLEIMKRTAVQVFFSRGPEFSSYSNQSSYLQTIYGAGLAHSFTRKALFAYDMYQGKNDYPRTGIASGDSLEKGIDRYATHSFRLNFRLGRNIVLNVLASLSKRDSKLAPRPVSHRNFFGLSLMYGHSSGNSSLSGTLISR
jgi:hypothetical protein